VQRELVRSFHEAVCRPGHAATASLLARRHATTGAEEGSSSVMSGRRRSLERQTVCWGNEVHELATSSVAAWGETRPNLLRPRGAARAAHQEGPRTQWLQTDRRSRLQPARVHGHYPLALSRQSW
jgi:hypothetical protein